MMKNAIADVMGPDKNSTKEGSLKIEAAKIAEIHGISFMDLTICVIDGCKIRCPDETNESSLLTVYNPNIQAQQGLLLKIRRFKLDEIRVEQYK